MRAVLAARALSLLLLFGALPFRAIAQAPPPARLCLVRDLRTFVADHEGPVIEIVTFRDRFSSNIGRLDLCSTPLPGPQSATPLDPFSSQALPPNSSRYFTATRSTISLHSHWPTPLTVTLLNSAHGSALAICDRRFHPSLYTLSSAAGRQEVEVLPARSLSVSIDPPSLAQRTLRWSAPKATPTAIVALAVALLAALKKRIEATFERFVDWLATIGGRRLRARRFRRRYLKALVAQHKYLRLVGFHTASINQPRLEEVFVSLRVGAEGSSSRAVLPSSLASPLASLHFTIALAKFRHLVILGRPGSGKTTALSFALLQFAQDLGFQAFGIRERLLPIYVPLRRLTQNGQSILDNLLDPSTQLVASDLLRECPREYFPSRLERGECIVLLDGLDEVTDEAAHRSAAERVAAMMESYPRNRFVVTCRTAGWKNLLPGFQVLEAQDFRRHEVQSFVRGWHRAVLSQMERGRLEVEIHDRQQLESAWEEAARTVVRDAVDVHTRRLLDAIDENPRIMAIATNPMLLSLICLVHLNRHVLPRERSLLYAQCVELLIDAWDRSRDITSPIQIDYSLKEIILRHIAFAFQRSGRIELSRSELEELVAAIATDLGLVASPRQLVKDIETRSGLLLERSIDVLGFSHLTLQEYLAAKHVQQQSQWLSTLEEHVDSEAWREVTLLYAGLLDDATAFIQRLSVPGTSGRWVLSGHCLGESRRCASPVTATIISHLSLDSELRDLERRDVCDGLAAILTRSSGSPGDEDRRLISLLVGYVTDESDAAKGAMQILGKARVSTALDALVRCLVGSPNQRLRLEAASAIGQFGNAALPSLSELVDHMALAEHPRELLAALSLINTGRAARLALLLYGKTRPELRTAVSLAISSMLRNELVEVDLLGLREDELPLALRTSGTSALWIYEGTPSAAFLRLYGRLCDDVRELIKLEEQGRAQVGRASIKILFPALITYIDRTSADRSHADLLEALGFMTTDDERADELWRAVRARRSLGRSPLSARPAPVEGNDQSVADWIASAVFVVTCIANWLWSPALLAPWLEPVIGMRQESALAALIAFLPIAFQVGIGIATLGGRRRGGSVSRLIGATLKPLQKIYDRLASRHAQRPWLPFGGFLLLQLACSRFGMLALSTRQAGCLGRDLLLFGAIEAGFVLVSVLYYRRIVLKSDPVRTLLSLHPEARVILG
jgi:NACHT domain